MRQAAGYKADKQAVAVVRSLTKKNQFQPVDEVLRGTFRVALQSEQCFGQISRSGMKSKLAKPFARLHRKDDSKGAGSQPATQSFDPARPGMPAVKPYAGFETGNVRYDRPKDWEPAD